MKERDSSFPSAHAISECEASASWGKKKIGNVGALCMLRFRSLSRLATRMMGPRTREFVP